MIEPHTALGFLASRSDALRKIRVERKRDTVEIADEVLRGRATIRPARIDAQQQHPARLAGSLDADREEIGTLPHAAVRGDVAAKFTDLCPHLEVRRREEPHPITGGQHHDPLLRSFVPDDLRVAKVAQPRIGDHGIADELGPRATPIVAPGETLCLEQVGLPCLLHGHVVVREHRDEGRLAADTEAAGVFPVHHCAAAEDQTMRVGIERDGQVLPAHEIRADGVAPVHGTPGGAFRIMLIEQMIFAVVEHHAVGIIHPLGRRREVILRPMRFAVWRAGLHGRNDTGLTRRLAAGENESNHH